MFSVSPEKLATPLTAATVTVPPRAERLPPGLLARAIVTSPLKALSTTPDVYSTAAVMPNGLLTPTPGGGGAVATRCVSATTPIAPEPSVNQNLPSGPAVIATGL